MDRPLNSNRHDYPDEIHSLGPTTPTSTEHDMDSRTTPLALIKRADLEAQHSPPAIVSDPSSYPGRPPGLHPLALPPLSLGQKLYIIVPQMIGAAILDGAANFAIGCAMYLNATNVRIWILKNNTVAGDMGVTIFIQGVLTFCIASGMVHVDLRKNKISAFQYPWPDTSWGAAKLLPPDEAQTKLGRLWRKFHNSQGFSRGLHFFSGSDVNDIFDSRLSRSQFTARLCVSLWKGSVLSAIFFFIMWPISIAIVSPIWAGANLGNGNFTAPIIKGVYGFVYGLLMNPICAMIAMGSEDSVRAHREERQQDRFEHPEKEAMKTTSAERVAVAESSRALSPSAHDGGPIVSKVSSNHTPQRIESLRRSLDTVGLRNQATGNVGFEDPQAPRGPGHAGLGWRSADVHRRRSLDTARRTSRGRYANPSGDLNRSTSVGSARIKPQPDTGLFGPSGQLTAPIDINHRHSSHGNLSGRMRTLSEHSAQL
ncbi:hypothetical protein MJO29_014740 [Puccinia striiformis f. sp. tritici]|uniref:hypothetical protein n=1 Tax=Puccinia striiformis f. sp. tritici TaxID=168172 RepID=UPI000A1295D9|nr:hypothetical protein Pst134EA_033164 [Puccinia striiformis f. sp. tritici]KAH9448528.1 hypothetical protein Pst134EA_033164 [Puccinia striiformis f. sp. tritici]KAI7937425.1 hypothetical protein MJO29_014740 [Puccinia striiformis f. sp. tritici]